MRMRDLVGVSLTQESSTRQLRSILRRFCAIILQNLSFECWKRQLRLIVRDEGGVHYLLGYPRGLQLRSSKGKRCLVL